MNYNKEDLIDSLDELEHEQNGLEFKTILYGLCMLLIITVICAPKIYLTSSIYYASVQTNTALDNYRSLKEERAHLNKKLELLRYNNEIGSSLAQ